MAFKSWKGEESVKGIVDRNTYGGARVRKEQKWYPTS
mgnify:FL=1